MKCARCYVVSVITVAGLFSFEKGVPAELNDLGQETYDFDVSWAIRSTRLSSRFGDKQAYYDDFIEGCRNAAGDKALWVCDDAEVYRMKMNTYQPLSMRNYTKLGFKKIKAPETLFVLIKEFWEKSRHLDYPEWKSFTPYHNLWDSPNTVINIENETLPGGGFDLQRSIWEASKDVMEEWTGQVLAPCALWGIRIYHDQAVLAPHVDRSPLVTSAIINVDQDVREPWPLEVWGHDGKPYNISMHPGDMVLYESHSVIHGRPFPLEGNFYANIFVHFEPVGAIDETGGVYQDPGAVESIAAGLPPYLIAGSAWESEWRDKNPDGWSLLYSDPHVAARQGDVRELKLIAAASPSNLVKSDQNGWRPIHEAARGGHLDAVVYLLERGALVNEGDGPSALEVAEAFLGTEHEVSLLLGNAQLQFPVVSLDHGDDL